MLRNLIDEKALEKNARKKEEEGLRLQVQQLQRELASRTPPAPGEQEAEISADAQYDVLLRVKPEKAAMIKSEMIDGQKCLIIPVDENEQINLNGVNTAV